MMNTISVMPPSWPSDIFINFFMRKDKDEKQIVIRENRKTLLIIVQAPGFIKDDIFIRFQGETLTIHACCHSLGEQSSLSRNFHRSITITQAVEAEKMTSLYEKGTLRIWLPKKKSIQGFQLLASKLKILKKSF